MFTNDNQPQQIGSFSLSNEHYEIYELPGHPDFLDCVEVTEEGDVIDSVLESIITSEENGVIAVSILSALDDTPNAPPLFQIKTTKENYLTDVTEAFKRHL